MWPCALVIGVTQRCHDGTEYDIQFADVYHTYMDSGGMHIYIIEFCKLNSNIPTIYVGVILIILVHFTIYLHSFDLRYKYINSVYFILWTFQ